MRMILCDAPAKLRHRFIEALLRHFFAIIIYVLSDIILNLLRFALAIHI